MVIFKPLDDKIVVFGQSCSGKTTFAKSLTDHRYFCFDALFQWHLVETLGLSIEANLRYVKETCKADKFVLDGWNLSDKVGKFLPEGSSVYVIWAPYDKIISQYRIDVHDSEEYRRMYNSWYCGVDYDRFCTRYFENDGEFKEISRNQFICSSGCSPRTVD